MFTKRTAFIVGAGASFELGLPLGDDLRGEIASLLDIRFGNGFSQDSGDYEICKALKEHSEVNGSDFNSLLHKCWLLRDALPAAISIDNLIDAHRNDEEIALIGKLAIAKSILSAERGSKLHVDPQHEKSFRLEKANGSWLIPLFQKLTENVSKEEVFSVFENVDFIVFNYDRTLEYFLPKAICAYYGVTEGDAQSICKRVRIIHPYGQVGGLFRDDKQGFAAFGADVRNLSSVAERIRTFSEGLQFETHREKIESVMSSAENIVFLGFAFHPINMEILKVEGAASVRNVFATTMGLADAAVRRVKEDVFVTLGKRPDDRQIAAAAYLSDANFEGRGASDFLFAHFRSLN